jgi:hypothetical protein
MEVRRPWIIAFPSYYPGGFTFRIKFGKYAAGWKKPLRLSKIFIMQEAQNCVLWLVNQYRGVIEVYFLGRIKDINNS